MLHNRMSLLLVCELLAFAASAQPNTNQITRAQVEQAAALIGLEFSEKKTDLMLPGLKEQLENFQAIRRVPLSNSVFPALLFDPLPPNYKLPSGPSRFRPSKPGKVDLPANLEDLAFYSVGQLAYLIKHRKISSEQLTRICLDRLKKHGPTLECVVTLTEDLALRQARRADAELAAGRYRGPLHGIPYGAKDLLDTKDIRTTWGAAPFTNRVPGTDATVIRRLEEAGAVLVAKTTLGELAWGEVWFGGKTRNPWKLEQGSSGSSAGSAAGVAAGLFAFAIGSETYGSIVSPSDRCGVTGLRPTYGRVSRAGAMSLSWTMDKIGPIARTAEDCAIAFSVISGPDPLDPTLIDAPFTYDHKVKLRSLSIGYLKSDFDAQKGERKINDDATLEKLRSLGARLIPVSLPEFPLGDISFVLSTEGAAAFDDLTREHRDDWMKRQERASWPNVFREARFIPAIEYLQAQRIRRLLIRDTARIFEQVDLFVAPSTAGRSLLLSNLTGHPCVVVSNGFSTNGTPTSICFIGNLFQEGEILALAKAYQDSTSFHRQQPPGFSSGGAE